MNVIKSSLFLKILLFGEVISGLVAVREVVDADVNILN
jgi:peptidoglycan hydrolase CwlO-like protein